MHTMPVPAAKSQAAEVVVVGHDRVEIHLKHGLMLAGPRAYLGDIVEAEFR